MNASGFELWCFRVSWGVLKGDRELGSGGGGGMLLWSPVAVYTDWMILSCYVIGM